MPRLQVLNGKRQGAVFDVAPGAEHVVGHRQSASITIDDPWVSWDHARLFFDDEEQACFIEDLGSTNGTYVNCVRVKRERLRHEDIIFLGKTHVIFLSPAEEHQGLGFGPDDASGSGEVPLASASQPGILGAGSSADPFAPSAEGTALPLRDPFQSAPSQTSRGFASGPGKGRGDPFAESGVDPFSSGPDYAASFQNSPPRSGSFRGILDPAREARSLSETNSDEQALIAPRGEGNDLRLSELDDDAELGKPSAQEISRLIRGPRGTGPVDAPRPRPPETLDGPVDPFSRSRQPNRPPPPPPPPQGSQAPAQAPRPAAMQMRSGASAPTRPAGSSATTRPLAPPAPASDTGMPEDLGKLAFERARLEDTVRRLRGALEAAKQQNPQAVAAAAQGLRDQELARQARRIAELEQQVVGLRLELEGKQEELDRVTEDMIEKEDTIDSLKTEIRRISSRVAIPQSQPNVDDRPHGLTSHDSASTYDNLPF